MRSSEQHEKKGNTKMKNIAIFTALAIVIAVLASCNGLPGGGHKHSETVDPAVPATCTESGLTEGAHCSECGEVLIPQETVPPSHTKVVDPRVTATCTTDGLTEGAHCSACDQTLLAQTVISAHHRINEENRCEFCNKPASNGLSFDLGHMGGYFAVSGAWSCTDSEVLVPSTYNGLPVASIEHMSGDFTRVVLPESVNVIEDFAFSGCTMLESIVLPSGLNSIGKYAFSNCTMLESITIPQGVYTIYGEAFEFCRSLKSIEVAAGNKYYKAEDGILYTKDGRYILAYAIGSDTEELTISDGVEQINKYAFNGANSLKSVTLPESLRIIELRAFAGCINLANINIPNGVTEIGGVAFEGCESLEAIVLPASLVRLDSSAFFGCSDLSAIYYCGTAEQWAALCSELDTSATVYFYSETEPSGEGNQWHLVDGEILLWN